MKLYQILFCSLAIIFAVCSCNKSKTPINLIFEKIIDDKPEEVFKIWHHLYKKEKYQIRSSEYNRRFITFKANLEEIKQWNSDSSNSWKKGLNQFSDLTQEEFEQKYLSNMRSYSQNNVKGAPPIALKSFVFVDILNDNKLIKDFAPVDWSDSTGPALDQKECGSCYAFATLNAIEANYFIKTGKRVVLSKQQVVDCNLTTNGCNGGWPIPVAIYAKSSGLMLESDYPYTAVKEQCKYDESKAGFDYIDGLTGHMWPTPLQLNLSRYNAGYAYEMLKKGPTVIAVDGGPFKQYSNGIFVTKGCMNVNHAVLLTGFGFDKFNIPYFIIKNSWGENWGENGFFRIFANDNDSSGNCFMYFFPYRPFYYTKPSQ